MGKKNTNPMTMACARQFSFAHSASSRRTLARTITAVVVASLILPTVVSGYPFQLTWTDINADEDGTIVYREISGVFHEVGFVGPNVTSFTDDPPGADGDTFCWSVRAFRDGEISGSSNEICATVPTTSIDPRRQTQDSGKAKDSVYLR
jgi:hypothetical protein